MNAANLALGELGIIMWKERMVEGHALHPVGQSSALEYRLAGLAKALSTLELKPRIKASESRLSHQNQRIVCCRLGYDGLLFHALEQPQRALALTRENVAERSKQSYSEVANLWSLARKKSI